MKISRRHTLLGAAAVGVFAALGEGFSRIAHADLAAADFTALRERWVDIVTGRKLIAADDPNIAAAIIKLDTAVEAVVADLLPEAGTRASVLSSANLAEENSKFITATARAPLTLATAWATPGSKYFEDEAIAAHARDALADFLRLRYNTSQREYGNWWDWEIGAARAVADVMCILFEQLPAELLEAADAGIRHFVPDPWRQFMAPRPHRVSTGANRIDLSQAVIASSIVTGDAERVRHAVEGLPATWAYVNEGDGFYRDGSFIQHTHVPYTGSYGGVLLTGLSALFALLSGSELDVPQSDREGIYRAIDEAVVPVMVEGQVLAAVRGRSVSRNFESGATHGGAILGAMLMLAKYAPADLGRRWQSVCKGWLERNTFDDFFDVSNIVRLSLMRLALDGPSSAPALTTPTMYPSMDRLIHRTPKWTAAVAMCSNRIAWYECGNGENELGSRTGSGMRYLYLPGQLDQYEDAFWPTMDHAAPPGATVDQVPLEPKVGGEWGEKTPENEWTGGLTCGEYSVAAMHLVGPDTSGLTARRMWFGTPRGLIELVSDVQTTSGPATTVVEHRKIQHADAPRLVVDGNVVDTSNEFKAAKWAHLGKTGGYVFLAPRTHLGQSRETLG